MNFSDIYALKCSLGSGESDPRERVTSGKSDPRWGDPKERVTPGRITLGRMTLGRVTPGRVGKQGLPKRQDNFSSYKSSSYTCRASPG